MSSTSLMKPSFACLVDPTARRRRNARKPGANGDPLPGGLGLGQTDHADLRVREGDPGQRVVVRRGAAEAESVAVSDVRLV